MGLERNRQWLLDTIGKVVARSMRVSHIKKIDQKLASVLSLCMMVLACCSLKYCVCGLMLAILPTPMQLKWNSSADKRKKSRLNPIGSKPIQRSRPSDLARSSMDSFLRPPSRPSLQVPQVHPPHSRFPDLRAEILLDFEVGELLYITSTYTGQPILGPTRIEFTVHDIAYPLQTSSTARSKSGVNGPSGYLSLTGTNWVCGETITSTLHIIARAERWGLQAMPP